MSIWDYSATPYHFNLDAATRSACLFCEIELKTDSLYFPDFEMSKELTVSICRQCGWWNATLERDERSGYRMRYKTVNVAYGILKKLDLADVRHPVQEISDYLTINYATVKDVHPKKFEDVVGAVFRNLGYNSVVTNYSGDKGIDVVLHDSQSNLIGVQVRRYKNKIEADQIREFTGALVLGGYTKGIFVTTSNYRSGAVETAALSGTKGFPIDLMNSEKFYDALKLSQNEITRKISWEMYPTSIFSSQYLQNYEYFEDEDRYDDYGEDDPD
ncbi:restriction endonuclease [Mucilaginibacter angelicae]|uniref:Restriction endonuclease n=1 Tax=Mucilaginibacter angelicae TaxID=869718 RepID=A0ABV6L4Y8_9SPHI